MIFWQERLREKDGKSFISFNSNDINLQGLKENMEVYQDTIT